MDQEPQRRDLSRTARRRRGVGVAVSATCHLALLLALSLAIPKPAPTVDVPPLSVTMIDLTPPPPPSPPAPAKKPAAKTPPKPKAKPTPAKAVKKKAVKPAARRSMARLSPPRHAHPLTLEAADENTGEDLSADAGNELTGDQLAGASSADSGPAGGVCDMPRLLQAALRKDPLVQNAVASFQGKAIMVWNGDWVRNGGEDGKGLAAVREAIMWEVAFAPKECRTQPVRGLVLLSANGHGTRLALGQGQWRWSDMLH